MYKFCFGHVNFEIPIRDQNEDIKYEIGCQFGKRFPQPIMTAMVGEEKEYIMIN